MAHKFDSKNKDEPDTKRRRKVLPPDAFLSVILHDKRLKIRWNKIFQEI